MTNRPLANSEQLTVQKLLHCLNSCPALSFQFRQGLPALMDALRLDERDKLGQFRDGVYPACTFIALLRQLLTPTVWRGVTLHLVDHGLSTYVLKKAKDLIILRQAQLNMNKKGGYKAEEEGKRTSLPAGHG